MSKMQLQWTDKKTGKVKYQMSVDDPLKMIAELGTKECLLCNRPIKEIGYIMGNKVPYEDVYTATAMCRECYQKFGDYLNDDVDCFDYGIYPLGDS